MPPRKRARASTSFDTPVPSKLTVHGGDADTFRESMGQLWSEGLLCDATVIVEGRHFTAHRLVLAASSAYMKCAFSTGMRESSSATITLDDLGAAVFEACLEWMYKGCATLDEELLPDLLQAASRLQMVPLLAEVEQLVLGRLCATNAISTWMLGDALTCPALVDAARGAVLKSFTKASATPDFLRVPAAWLESLLADDKLEVKQEEDVYASLKAWHAAKQPPPTADIVERLLALVRWPLMDESFINESVLSDALVTRHSGGAMVLLDAFKTVAYGRRPTRRIGVSVELRFESAFDTNGVLHHIGTAGGTEAYRNPHEAGRVVAAMSSAEDDSCPERFVQHTSAADNATGDDPNSWMSVDLGEGRSLRPDHYCLRTDSIIDSVLRSWRLEGSHDGSTWVALSTHTDDISIEEVSFATAAWPVEGVTEAFRHFRILQTGYNSSGVGHHHLSCAGIELYGAFRGSVA
jgi:hypothetical protein